ncbi:MAG: hypothetical protein GY859_27605 [Desulfobacterales bacterium]|nr:hypothetical protein [Desulfobacterales bacterium]
MHRARYFTGEVNEQGLKDIDWHGVELYKLFDNHFKDPTEFGGYFSHIDPDGLIPHADSPGDNKAKKIWNSVGDHAPAYLILNGIFKKEEHLRHARESSSFYNA